MSGKQASLGRLFGVLLAGLLLCCSTMGALAAGVDLVQTPSHAQRLQTEFDERSAGIMRLGSLSSDANLRSVSVAPSSVGQTFDFVSGVGNFVFPYGTRTFLLELRLSNSAATIVVNQSPITSGGTWRGQLPPNGDAMTVEIKVTAEDGVTERVYRITAAADQTPPVQPYSLTVGPSSLSAAVAGTEYPSTRLTAYGGVPPYRFSVKQGALPRGMGLTPEGVLSGTPQDSGRFSFTVMAVDVNSFTGDLSLELDVDAPQITLSPSSLPNGVAGMQYPDTVFSAQGGRAPYTMQW